MRSRPLFLRNVTRDNVIRGFTGHFVRDLFCKLIFFYTLPVLSTKQLNSTSVFIRHQHFDNNWLTNN